MKKTGLFNQQSVFWPVICLASIAFLALVSCGAPAGDQVGSSEAAGASLGIEGPAFIYFYTDN